jgi:hypothetical protein
VYVYELALYLGHSSVRYASRFKESTLQVHYLCTLRSCMVLCDVTCDKRKTIDPRIGTGSIRIYPVCHINRPYTGELHGSDDCFY